MLSVNAGAAVVVGAAGIASRSIGKPVVVDSIPSTVLCRYISDASKEQS